MAKEEKKESKKEIQKVEPTQGMRPFEEMDRFFDRSFFEEMDRFFGDRLPGRWGGWRHPFSWDRPLFGQLEAPFKGKTPRVDLIEHDEKFIVKAELPGVDKKDINVTVSNNVVTLEADTSKEEKEERGDYYRREIARGAYRRTLVLPTNVKEDQVKAKFKSGVLELTIPKVEKTKRTNVKIE